MKNLHLVELNEVNFDLVESYTKKYPGKFPNIEKLLMQNGTLTHSELEYQNIEPWIQWVSVHTMCDYEEHKVFRLGDIINSDLPQIFELVEKRGYRVSCTSPMNTVNRLSKTSIFIPDPWTDTNADSSFWSRALHKALVQAVNDNAKSKLKSSTVLILGLAFLVFSSMANWKTYFKLIMNRNKSWNKALFLDLFLSDLHFKRAKNARINFSTIFQNAFAHIQHHYFLNSQLYNGTLKNPSEYISQSDDPIFDALIVYDKIIKRLLLDDDYEFILATGLRQVPVEKQKIYYRLREHKDFLTSIGLVGFDVSPRMTRDFLLTFESSKSKEENIRLLRDVTLNEKKLFDHIEERDEGLFVTLTYDGDLDGVIKLGNLKMDISPSDALVFVAVKNGHHDGTGYIFTNNEIMQSAFEDKVIHVKEIGMYILQYFNPNQAPSK